MEIINKFYNINFLNNFGEKVNNLNNFLNKKQLDNKLNFFKVIKDDYYKKINKVNDDIILNNNNLSYNNICLDSSKGVNVILDNEAIKNLIDSTRNNQQILHKIALMIFWITKLKK